jgi:hypothetical protein
MATSRTSDINLIVRARTEGEKAISGLGDILESLFDDARRGSGDIATLGTTLGALDKAAQAIAGSMDKAGAAVDRQRASIAENNAAYAALLRQQAEAQRVLASFGDQGAKDFVGPRTKAFTEQYAGVRAEVARLETTIDNLFAKIGQQNAQLGSTQSSLLKLSATSGAVAQGQAEAEAQIELTTAALREQAAAAERVTDIQHRINTVTGVNRPSAPGSAAGAADLLLGADAEFRRKEAAEAEAAALRLVNNQLAERAHLEAAIERSTGAGRPRATDNGATISALTELVNNEHKAAQAIEQMDREAAQLRATLDPLAAIQERFNTQLARFKELATAGRISARELAAAEDHLADQAERARAALAGGGNGRGADGKIGLFGLKPYELQNLSYQVNDVVTGLASGQHATQIIAQQGGQILQLFPKVAGQLIGALSNPAVLGFVGTVGLIAVALNQAADNAARLREFTSDLAIRADGDTYDPKVLAQQADDLERLGASRADATAAMKEFVEQGLNPARFGEFSKAAQDTADALGQALPEAAKSVATAFSGGYDAIAQFDDKLNFLTASEREHIRSLFDEGRASEARNAALRIYAAQMDDAAQKSRGEWASSTRELNGAWKDFLDLLSNSSVIQTVSLSLGNLAGAARAAIRDLRSAGDAAAQLDQINDKKKAILDLEAKIAANPNAADIGASRSSLADANRGLAVLIRRYDELAGSVGAYQKVAGAGALPKGDTVAAGSNTADAKKRAERLGEIDAEQQLQALRQRGAAGLNAVDSRRRAALAGELAFRQEMASTGDAIVAARLREVAAAKEQGDIDKANETARKAAQSSREREIKQFEGRVIGAEGGAGKNPHGSAQGYGQFIDSTWKAQFAQVFPEQARSLSSQQILALRQNEQVARAVIDNYARENARFLESFGAKVTAGNLYLAYFLGAGGAKAILTAPGNKPVDQIIARLPNAAKVLSGNQGYLRTEGGKGRYRTSSELQSFIANRVGDKGQPQSQGQAAINNLIDDAKQKQDAFNRSLQHTAEDRQASIDALRAEAGLQGNALIAEQRRQLIVQAELDLRQKAEDANRNLKPGEAPVVVSQEQIDKAKELAGALFDAQRARDALNNSLQDAQRPLDTLEQQRDLLIEQRDLLQSMGEFKAAAEVDEQITKVGSSIKDAYDRLIEFYRALSPDQRVRLGILDEGQLDNIIKKLELAKRASEQWGKVLGIGGEQVAQMFAGAAANAFTNFINKVAAGKNVFEALGQSIREFAANFISSMAQALVQLLAFAAAVQVMRALGVPIPASFGVGQHHTGGIAGASAGGVRRTVAPEMFTAAMRYHNGGIAGFAPDEVPAILKRNEEVLTEGDPRHRFNGGAAGDGGMSGPRIKIVNTFNMEDAASQMLGTRNAEKAILNMIAKNQRAVRGAMGR